MTVDEGHEKQEGVNLLREKTECDSGGEQGATE